MRYDRLFTKLFCQPLLLEGTYRLGLEMALLSVMEGKTANIDFAARKVDGERSDQRADGLLEVNRGTAIIHIDGAIDKNLSSWDRLCFNATDLNDVDRALARVAADRTIQNVMFAIDSPGGGVPGVPETAARIAALAEQKNCFAYLATGCSAAYWIASQCDQIFASPSSQVGSIGVYLALIDQSRALDARGLKVDALQSGKLKTAGAPWKPLSETERDHLQSRVDQIGTMFRAAVTDKRPQVQPETMEGQSFIGTTALENGLVDCLVGSLEEAIAQF